MTELDYSASQTNSQRDMPSLLTQKNRSRLRRGSTNMLGGDNTRGDEELVFSHGRLVTQSNNDELGGVFEEQDSS